MRRSPTDLAGGKVRDLVCFLKRLLRIHSPDCARCNARELCWSERLERIEELNVRAAHFCSNAHPQADESGVARGFQP